MWCQEYNCKKHLQKIGIPTLIVHYILAHSGTDDKPYQKLKFFANGLLDSGYNITSTGAEEEK